MATLAQFVSELKFWGFVQPSEGLSDPSDLELIVQKAVAGHNPQYKCDATACTVPDREVVAISTLSLALLAQWRAFKHAQTVSTRTGDFQILKDTPFEKNSKLYKEQMAKYVEQCKALGLNSYYGSQTVRSSVVTIEHPTEGYETPYELAMEPPVVNLSLVGTITGGTGIFLLEFQLDNRFSQRYFYHIEGTDSIYQPWNSARTLGVPKVNPSASRVVNTTEQRLSTIKLVNLSMTPGTTHRFLVVTENRNGIFGYSNELTVVIP